MKIKYHIEFDGEINITGHLTEEEIRDEIAREFYERGSGVYEATVVEWEEIKNGSQKLSKI